MLSILFTKQRSFMKNKQTQKLIKKLKKLQKKLITKLLLLKKVIIRR